jgi:para-nitrobenzyl esterase
LSGKTGVNVLNARRKKLNQGTQQSQKERFGSAKVLYLTFVLASPEIETSFGRVRGLESAGIHTFRGVPYAAPIEGVRRFLPPVDPEPWTGVRDCTRNGEAVPQISLPVFTFINGAGSRLGSDCLSVNVWTPGLDTGRRPVLVWIHGGGFLVGAGSTAIYNGRSLASRGDVVVVTINYRLGALGYAHLGTVFGDEFAESTNLGVRDQIAALRWVRENIERFGGDPGNVTVFGQSAGGMSTAALLASPQARPLFRRAICMSGAGGQVIDRDTAAGVAREFVSRLGGPAPSQRALSQIPMSEILRAQGDTVATMSNLYRLMVFVPFVDGDVITEQPLDAVRSGAARDIPILTGTTLEEWKLFRALDPGLRPLSWEEVRVRFELMFREAFPGAPTPEQAAHHWREALSGRTAGTTPSEAWCAFQSARMFHYPCAQLAEAQSLAGGSAHRYLVTWRAPAARRALGAAHAIDVPFVFGAASSPLALPLAGIGGAAREFGDKMQAAFLAFARDGSPGDPSLPDWPAYEPSRRATMILGRKFVVEDAPLEPERQLFEQWTEEFGSALAEV